ncbi:MAG: NAD-dependent epimerase/dehydratase family protein [Bacteroidia bacterium]
MNELMDSTLNILVTGSSGFIGSRWLQLMHEKYKLSTVSLRKTAIQDVQLEGVDTILHLAGLAHQMEAVNPSKYFEINTDLTLALAKKAKAQGVKHFVYISTTKVYGDGEDQVFYNEKSKCIPTDHYGESKLKAENKLKKLRSDSFLVSIVRPPLVYGPGVKGNLLLFMKLAKTPYPLPFKGISNNRAMVYVDNLIAMISKIIDSRKEGIFTLTDQHRISTEELIAEIREQMGRSPKLFKLPGILVLPIKWLKPHIYFRLFGSFNVDCSESLKTLNFTIPYAFEDGIRAMVSHYQIQKTKS